MAAFVPIDSLALNAVADGTVFFCAYDSRPKEIDRITQGIAGGTPVAFDALMTLPEKTVGGHIRVTQDCYYNHSGDGAGGVDRAPDADDKIFLANVWYPIGYLEGGR